MLLCHLGFVLLLRTQTVAGYFPLVPGQIRTYEDVSGRKTISTDEVLSPVQVSGQEVFPVNTREGRSLIITNYYRVDGDIVYLLGSDLKNLFPDPLPIIKFSGQPTSWNYSGPVSQAKHADIMGVLGECKSTKDQNLFGKSVKCIQTKLKAQIGYVVEGDGDEQVAIYGQGIGLIQLTTVSRAGKARAVSVRKLIRIEEAQGHG